MSRKKGIPGPMNIKYGNYTLAMHKNKNGGVTGVMYKHGLYVATLGSTKRRSQTVRAAEVWVSLAPTEVTYGSETGRISADQWRAIQSRRGKSIWTQPK